MNKKEKLFVEKLLQEGTFGFFVVHGRVPRLDSKQEFDETRLLESIKDRRILKALYEEAEEDKKIREAIKPFVPMETAYSGLQTFPQNCRCFIQEVRAAIEREAHIDYVEPPKDLQYFVEGKQYFATKEVAVLDTFKKSMENVIWPNEFVLRNSPQKFRDLVSAVKEAMQ
jgi:hypothetical protein